MFSPDEFDSLESYLQRAVTFLKSNKWIFCYKNTGVLTEKVLSYFPKKWEYFFRNASSRDLNALFKEENVYVPSTLKQFISQINRLRPPPQLNIAPEKLTNFRNSGLSEKKTHEILSLAPVIREVCIQTGCNLVVDIGSGLGYLPHLLFENYTFEVLGLEISKNFVELAKKHQAKYHANAKNGVLFSNMRVHENSAADIAEVVEKHFGPNRTICLTGLHACADLGIDMLKLFENFKNAKALVVMPCCYHRISVKQEDTDRVYFNNFPTSTTLSKLFDEQDAFVFVNQPFLRLACQQTLESFTRMTEEEHERHSQQCMFRAILQLVAETENSSVRRLKRKSGIKSNAADSDDGFEAYLNNLASTHELQYPNQKNEIKITDEAFLLKMHEKWKDCRGDCCLVEALTGLQAALQSVCENVILLDRVAFLREKGFHCYCRKITNDVISPRCWALVATKTL